MAEKVEWLYTPATKAETLAIKAVAAGTADEHQQRMAMAWIIEKACRTYDLEYRPSPPFAETDTVLAIGKRSVGLEIVREINIDHTKLRKPGEKDSEQG